MLPTVRRLRARTTLYLMVRGVSRINQTIRRLNRRVRRSHLTHISTTFSVFRRTYHVRDDQRHGRCMHRTLGRTAHTGTLLIHGFTRRRQLIGRDDGGSSTTLETVRSCITVIGTIGTRVRARVTLKRRSITTCYLRSLGGFVGGCSLSGRSAVLGLMNDIGDGGENDGRRGFVSNSLRITTGVRDIIGTLSTNRMVSPGLVARGSKGKGSSGSRRGRRSRRG